MEKTIWTTFLKWDWVPFLRLCLSDIILTSTDKYLNFVDPIFCTWSLWRLHNHRIFLSQRIVPYWNNLLVSIREAVSVDDFEMKYDRHFWINSRHILIFDHVSLLCTLCAFELIWLMGEWFILLTRGYRFMGWGVPPHFWHAKNVYFYLWYKVIYSTP